jgi:predicted sugar kinase
MNNPYLTIEEINKAFHEANLVESYNFVAEDLVSLASVFVMAAMPAIVRNERSMCIKFVASLNSEVAKALEEKRKNL